jgi:hypothetical protein
LSFGNLVQTGFKTKRAETKGERPKRRRGKGRKQGKVSRRIILTKKVTRSVQVQGSNINKTLVLFRRESAKFEILDSRVSLIEKTEESPRKSKIGSLVGNIQFPLHRKRETPRRPRSFIIFSKRRKSEDKKNIRMRLRKRRRTEDFKRWFALSLSWPQELENKF